MRYPFLSATTQGVDEQSSLDEVFIATNPSLSGFNLSFVDEEDPLLEVAVLFPQAVNAKLAIQINEINNSIIFFLDDFLII